MHTFNYYDTFGFDKSGPNQPQSITTTYYKAHEQDRQKLLQYVEKVLNQLEEVASIDNEVHNTLRNPIKNKRWQRTNKTYYSPFDVVRDLHRQLSNNKDATRSMIDRWNDVMDYLNIPDYSIELNEQ